MRLQLTLFKSLAVVVAFAATASSTIKAQIYGQCDGDGYDADCPEGYTCQPVNPYYSQCAPIGTKSHTSREIHQQYDKKSTNRRSETVAIPDVFDPVGGPNNCTGCAHRRNIEDLQATYPAVFNMFILALEALQKDPESVDISYYQIAGIHGRPYIKWQQVIPPEDFNSDLGYCTHTSRIFNTWHRPYLALLEQTLCSRAKRIAAQFTGQAYATYSAAAEQVRLPYWDWAHETYGTCLPAVVMQPTISVTRPGTNGAAQTETIANPLYQYSFTDSSYLAQYFEPGDWSQWTTTRRHPDASGNSDNAAACDSVNDPTSRRSAVFAMLGTGVDYNNFNTELENVHNDIHVEVGGGGHMSQVDYAAFDPIFWLHHCNVDRIVAMYQATHPNNWLTPGEPVATYGRVVPGVDGPEDDLNTNLYPFRKPTGQYYTSEDVKLVQSTWSLKYGYDEVPCNYRTESAAALNSYTRTRINELYGPKLVSEPSFAPVDGNLVRDEFVIKSVIDASEIPGSWTLHAFDGKPSGAPADYAKAENRIASYSMFGNPGERHRSFIYDNELPISDTLTKRKLKYKKESIVSHLTKNLYYAITTAGTDCIEIPIDSLKSFKLGVYTVTATYADPRKAKDVAPVYGTPRYVPEITKGKPGGITSEKDISQPVLLNGTRVDLDTYYQ